ncbi:hypothetical protein [Flavobacterium gelatinilyticum]|uniref:hypothetical protein n=1 Tax=Flavobacterium gelatinilyticum TaxID=3003260 RepID=UPI00248008FD|nr:hypothetical protein [Flavobacterium gelatinilyticum]
MKTNFYNTAVMLTILPAFFFIAGCLSWVRMEETLHKFDMYELLFLFIVLFTVSYVFLKNSISVLISIGCSVNVMFGILFFIDLFEVQNSSLRTAAIIISLSFSLFINTILLSSVYQYKKPSDTNARQAVVMALKMNFWTILLSFLAVLLLLFWSYSQSQSDPDFLPVPFKYFVWTFFAGASISVITAFTMLPVCSFFWLGHLKEERPQDDLTLSFTENKLLRFNEIIEKNIAYAVWIVSPAVTNKKISTLITIFAAVFTIWSIVGNTEPFYFIIVSIVYFLFVVIRYQSYILALAPVLSIVFNYLVLTDVFKLIKWDSEDIMHISFFVSMTAAITAGYLQSNTAWRYYKNNFKIQDAVLNANAKTLYLILGSVIVSTFFLSLFVYSVSLHTDSLWDLFLMGAIITASGLLLVFPGAAFLNTALHYFESFRKPNKKRVKSIYL